MNLKITTLAVALATSLSLSAHAEDLMDIYKEALQKDTQVAQAKADADAANSRITASVLSVELLSTNTTSINLCG